MDSNNKYLQTYLPSSILSYVQEQEEKRELDPTLKQQSSGALELPIVYPYETVVLFADVSGYTALCERMSLMEGGDEHLAKHLNSYFELLMRAIQGQGGDIFKFAGDALLVVWPPSDEPIESLTRRAAQCAIDIKQSFQDAVLVDGVRLSVKLGIGCGPIRILHLGGVLNRLEYLTIGEPLVQAFSAEHHAVKREVVVSPTAWELIKDCFEGIVQPSGHVFLTECTSPLKKVGIKGGKTRTADPPTASIIPYIPSAVVKFAEQTDEKWISELRNMTVVFVNLGFKESELVSMSAKADLDRLQNVLKEVQFAVYRCEGSLNKFLMDDKGSTLIAVFGLYPISHQDDATRAVLCSLRIEKALQALDLRPSIGITTGSAFVGDVGTKSRREYSCLGDTVNLSARIMQHATKSGSGVLCDAATAVAVTQNPNHWHPVTFHQIAQVPVKGKVKPVSLFQPVAKAAPANVVDATLRDALKKFEDTNQPQADRVICPWKYVESEDIDEATLVARRANKVNVANDPELMSVKKQLGQIILRHGRTARSEPGDTGSAAATTPPATPTGAAEVRTIILQSEAGLGKTTALHATLAALPKSVPVFFGAGDPYNTHSPLRMWNEVIACMLDRANVDRPRKYVRQLVGQAGFDVRALPCLNDVTRWNFEETAESKAMQPDERLANCKSFFECILAHLAVLHKPTLIIVIEDATYLDPASWDLSYALAKRVPAIVQILATRPMDKTHLMFRQSTNFAPYEAIRGEATTRLITLQPRNDVLMKAIAAQLLDVSELPVSLMQLVLSKAQGNPYILKTILIHYIQTDLIRNALMVDGFSRLVILSPRLQKTIDREIIGEKNVQTRGVQTPLPTGVLGLFGSRLDRLALSQIMILKVAAVLGPVWSVDVLCKCMTELGLVASSSDGQGWSLQQVTDAVNELHALEVINQTHADRSTYSFATAVMRDVIISRTLEHHQEVLMKMIRLHSSAHAEAAANKERAEADTMFADSLLEGYLLKQGVRLRKWKSRYFCLFRDRILYFSSKGDSSKVRPKGSIPLYEDTVVEAAAFRLLEKGDKKEEQTWTFQIFPSVGGKKSDFKAKYELQAEDEKLATKWIQAVRGVIKDKQMLTPTGTRSPRNLASSPRAPSTENKRGSTTNIFSGFLPQAKSAQETKLFQESLKEGYLVKQGHGNKTWKRRYFILFRDKLMYFERDDVKLVKGDIPICEESVVEHDADAKDPGQFSIFPGCGEEESRRYTLIAHDLPDAKQWVQEVGKAIKEIRMGPMAGGRATAKKEAKMAAHSVMEGYMQKRGGKLKNWSNRYFVLFNDRLQYFKSRDDVEMTGEFSLWLQTTAEVKDDGLFIVTPVPGRKAYELKAQNVELATQWVAVILEQAALCGKVPSNVVEDSKS